MRKIILFGAGNNSKLAIEKYGKENIAYLADNSEEKIGSFIEGIEVISFNNMIEKHRQGFIIVITPVRKTYMIGQLEKFGVFDYLLFENNDNDEYISNRLKSQCHFKDNNDKLIKYAELSGEQNLLEDISEFKKICKNVLDESQNGMSLFWVGPGDEGHYYGNLNGILSYSGLTEESALHFPIVSHEDCSPLFSPGLKYKSAVAFSGEYYKNRVHEHRPYVPVFTLGPYIQYVDGIYDEFKVNELKKSKGKTLLAFLPHSIEFVSRLYDKKEFINKIIQLYGNKYNNIMLCSYWADINDPVCEYAESQGIKVVTAGFRFDEKFDSRLKSIIELSDAVVCGDIGTHISYSLCLNKPVGRINITNDMTIKEGELHSDVDRALELSGDYATFKKGFFKYFDENIRLTEEQVNWMNPVSGLNIKRTPEYIKKIYRISKDIWENSDGNLKQYAGAVSQTYYQYDNLGEYELMTILKGSLGSYLF